MIYIFIVSPYITGWFTLAYLNIWSKKQHLCTNTDINMPYVKALSHNNQHLQKSPQLVTTTVSMPSNALLHIKASTKLSVVTGCTQLGSSTCKSTRRWIFWHRWLLDGRGDGHSLWAGATNKEGSMATKKDKSSVELQQKTYNTLFRSCWHDSKKKIVLLAFCIWSLNVYSIALHLCWMLQVTLMAYCDTWCLVACIHT